MRALARRSGWLVVLAAVACSGGVEAPDGASGAASGTSTGGGAGGAGAVTTGSGSSAASASSGGGRFDPAVASSSSSGGGAGEVHEMCFGYDPGPPCPTMEEAPGHLCDPCFGKGCYFVGEVVGGPVFEDGACCYDVVGECIPAP